MTIASRWLDLDQELPAAIRYGGPANVRQEQPRASASSATDVGQDDGDGIARQAYVQVASQLGEDTVVAGAVLPGSESNGSETFCL